MQIMAFVWQHDIN